jgi:hypothetical protein
LVHKAIHNGIANIEWKDSAFDLASADRRLRQVGLTPKGIWQLLHEFVFNGNSLTVRTEKRTEKLEEDPYWYRAIIPIPEFPRGLFVEVILQDPDEDDPLVQIVNAHEQLS